MAIPRRVSPETDIRPLREIFAERKELIAKYVPAETLAVHARAIAELRQRHLAANILPVGSEIPEFQLQDHDGKSVSSADLLAKGRLVLCLIPRALVPVLRRSDGGDEPCPA